MLSYPWLDMQAPPTPVRSGVLRRARPRSSYNFNAGRLHEFTIRFNGSMIFIQSYLGTIIIERIRLVLNTGRMVHVRANNLALRGILGNNHGWPVNNIERTNHNTGHVHLFFARAIHAFGFTGVIRIQLLSFMDSQPASLRAARRSN